MKILLVVILVCAFSPVFADEIKWDDPIVDKSSFDYKFSDETEKSSSSFVSNCIEKVKEDPLSEILDWIIVITNPFADDLR